MTELLHPPYSQMGSPVQMSPMSVGGNMTGDVVVLGAGAMRAQTYVAGSAGWRIDGQGNLEANDGNFRGDITGATGTFTGALAASSIDIGGTDATSWHVDSAGNMWWGSAGSYAAATIRISSAGVVDFTSGNWSGDIAIGTGNTIVKADSNGLYVGHATFGSAPFRVTQAGVVTATDMSLTGNLSMTSTGLIRTATSGHRTELVGELFSVAGTDVSGLAFYTNNSDEVEPGYIYHFAVKTGAVDSGHLRLQAPDMGGNSAHINLETTDGASSSRSEINVVAEDVLLDGRVAVVDRILHWGAATADEYIEHEFNLGFKVVTDGDDHIWFDDDGMIHVRSEVSGSSTIPDGSADAGVFLYSNDMNTTAKYTPGVIFGSADANFTTENPKPLAGLWGFATETYAGDSDGGMGIEVVTPEINPGMSGIPSSAARGFFMQASGFHPRVDDLQDLGTSSLRWDDVYATNGTIQTSDARDKTLLPDAQLGLDFMLALNGDAFTRTGGSRIHHGTTAQGVAKALRKVGRDPVEHGIYIDPGRRARKGVRYGELWGPAINSFAELDRRIAALEAAAA